MQHLPNRSAKRVERVKAAPRMTADERDRSIQDFVDAGLATRITAADVIAYHDEINRKRSFVHGTVRRNAK